MVTIEPPLREPLLYSNWVLILGIFLIVVAVVWVLGFAIAYRHSRVHSDFEVRTLSQAHRARYEGLIGEVALGYQTGELNAREAHLALGAIIRAAATERTRVNLESSTASEAQVLIPTWPLLVDALRWCEDGSFPTNAEQQRVEAGLNLAAQVVLQ